MGKELNIQIETIFVNCGRTINLGDYESVKIDAGITLRANIITSTPEEREEIKTEMYEIAWGIVRKEIRYQERELKKRIKKNREDD